eukprot:scaffold197600_cov40-Attheya_sp.AAC.2
MPPEDRDTMTYAAATAIEKFAMDVIFPSLVSAGFGEGDDYENSSAERVHLPKGQRPSLPHICRSVRFSHRAQNHSSFPNQNLQHPFQDDIYHARTT